jgi:hypothetical protein
MAIQLNATKEPPIESLEVRSLPRCKRDLAGIQERWKREGLLAGGAVQNATNDGERIYLVRVVGWQAGGAC